VTETEWQRKERDLSVSLFESILEEDAVEARLLSEMKDEANLKIGCRETSKRLRRCIRIEGFARLAFNEPEAELMMNLKEGIDNRRRDVAVQERLLTLPFRFCHSVHHRCPTGFYRTENRSGNGEGTERRKRNGDGRIGDAQAWGGAAFVVAPINLRHGWE
jgi:hypothetical protein